MVYYRVFKQTIPYVELVKTLASKPEYMINIKKHLIDADVAPHFLANRWSNDLIGVQEMIFYTSLSLRKISTARALWEGIKASGDIDHLLQSSESIDSSNSSVVDEPRSFLGNKSNSRAKIFREDISKAELVEIISSDPFVIEAIRYHMGSHGENVSCMILITPPMEQKQLKRKDYVTEMLEYLEDKMDHKHLVSVVIKAIKECQSYSECHRLANILHILHSDQPPPSYDEVFEEPTVSIESIESIKSIKSTTIAFVPDHLKSEELCLKAIEMGVDSEADEIEIDKPSELEKLGKEVWEILDVDKFINYAYSFEFNLKPYWSDTYALRSKDLGVRFREIYQSTNYESLEMLQLGNFVRICRNAELFEVIELISNSPVGHLF